MKFFPAILIGLAAAIVSAVASADSDTAQAGTPPPIIDEQPIGFTASSNAPAGFSVLAHGIGLLDYQWWKDGQKVTNNSRISGAASPVLSISSLQFSDGGGYTAVVTNGGGAITSSVAFLEVKQPAIAVEPLGATGALVSVRGPIGDVYRIELSVDFGPWITNGYATNFKGVARFLDRNTGGFFRNFRPSCERILPVMHAPKPGDPAGTVRVYGKLNEVWQVQGSTNFLHWNSVATVTNLTAWTKISDTNEPALPYRFYRIAGP